MISSSYRAIRSYCHRASTVAFLVYKLEGEIETSHWEDSELRVANTELIKLLSLSSLEQRVVNPRCLDCLSGHQGIWTTGDDGDGSLQAGRKNIGYGGPYCKRWKVMVLKCKT